jgi:hypothetical protein
VSASIQADKKCTLGVPGRLIFHVIKIGRSARAGKATAMENGLKKRGDEC